MTAETTQKPNAGAAVPDTIANGDENESQAAWLKQRGIDLGRRIKLTKLSHMRYQHPNLEEIHQFLIDFGMEVAKRTETEIWYRGYGTDNYVYYATKGERKFLGGAFEVASMEDLETASHLPGACEVKELKDAPGGGYIVTVPDPEGFPLNLIFGQRSVSSQDAPNILPVNYGVDKNRVRKFQRFSPGPAAVHKLGHFGMCTTKFDDMLSFYTTNFNIVPSDFIYVLKDGKKEIVTTFCHLDLGDNPVDHHSFFLSANPTTHVHHCSFEVHDYDTQHLGHQWLAKKGYTSVWGLGRHVLGSQIFDYWWDTTGNMVEHYADGDLVTSETPISYLEAGHESLAVWGPELPPTFLS